MCTTLYMYTVHCTGDRVQQPGLGGGLARPRHRQARPRLRLLRQLGRRDGGWRHGGCAQLTWGGVAGVPGGGGLHLLLPRLPRHHRAAGARPPVMGPLRSPAPRRLWHQSSVTQQLRYCYRSHHHLRDIWMHNSTSTNVLSGGFEWCSSCTPAMSVYHEAVLRFDPGTLQWTQVGHTIYTVSKDYLHTIYTLSK